MTISFLIVYALCGIAFTVLAYGVSNNKPWDWCDTVTWFVFWPVRFLLLVLTGE